MHIPRFFRCCGLLLALAGCGSDDNKYGGIPIDDAPEEIAKSVCPAAWRCCMASQLMNNANAGTDEQSCEVKTAENYRKNLATIKRSQDKGRVVYRGDKLKLCMDYVRSATCQQLNRTNHFSGLDCEPYTEPKVAGGATCEFDWECVDGYCEKAPMAGEGVCRPAAVAGASCEVAPCAKGLSCNGGSKTCVAPAPPSTAPAGNMCFYASSCSYGRGRVPALGLLALTALLAALRRRKPAGAARPTCPPA